MAEHFDEEEFLALIEGDKQLFQRLIEIFDIEYKELLENLKKSVAANDFKLVEQSAHRLKGNLRNFYSEKSAKHACFLEEGARLQNLDGADVHLANLETAVGQFLTELKSYYETYSP